VAVTVISCVGVPVDLPPAIPALKWERISRWGRGQTERPLSRYFGMMLPSKGGRMERSGSRLTGCGTNVAPLRVGHRLALSQFKGTVYGA